MASGLPRKPLWCSGHARIASLRQSQAPVQATFDSDMEAAKKELGYWDSYLADDPQYIAGDAFTLADINTVLTLLYILRVGGSLEEYPHVKKYAERHKGRDSIVESWPPHWKETPSPDWLAGL